MQLAQVNPTTLPSIFPPARFATVGSLLSIIIPLIVIVAALFLLALFLAGAFKIITAGGEPEKFQSAQNTLRYAILGFVLIILALLITRIIGRITGIQLPI